MSLFESHIRDLDFSRVQEGSKKSSGSEEDSTGRLQVRFWLPAAVHSALDQVYYYTSKSQSFKIVMPHIGMVSRNYGSYVLGRCLVGATGYSKSK